MTELCFLIPTYNRFDRLIRTLTQIEKVFSNSKIIYEIFIIDNSSDEKTFEFFSKNRREKTTYYKRKNSIQNGNLSVHQSLLEITKDSKWYWWLGDDDYILPESIKFLDYCINSGEIDYLHATDATFTLTESSIVDTGERIVNHFGILELTSFMSSQIFTRKILFELRKKIIERLDAFDWNFNFNHSLLISETIWTARCMVSAEGMVLAQNHVHKETENNKTAIAFYHSLRGWFNLADFTGSFARKVNLKEPLNQRLFHYRAKPIWNSYLIWIISFLTMDTSENVPEDLQKISRLIQQSDTGSPLCNYLIDTIIQIEKLRSNTSTQLFEQAILPFYRNTLEYLKSTTFNK